MRHGRFEVAAAWSGNIAEYLRSTHIAVYQTVEVVFEAAVVA